MSQKGHVIKRNNRMLSLSDYRVTGPGQDVQLRHYVVGFKTAVLARKVHYNIHPSPYLRLEHRDVVDITTDVNTRLKDVDPVDGLVTVHMSSRLFVPKMEHNGGPLYPGNDGGFHLETVDIKQLYMMPFSKNVGVIFPYDIESESRADLVLICQVINPANSTQYFKPC